MRKVINTALAAGGGAYLDSLPVLLPDIVVMFVTVILLGSCAASAVGVGDAGLRFYTHHVSGARKEPRHVATSKAGAQKSSRAVSQEVA